MFKISGKLTSGGIRFSLASKNIETFITPNPKVMGKSRGKVDQFIWSEFIRVRDEIKESFSNFYIKEIKPKL